MISKLKSHLESLQPSVASSWFLFQILHRFVAFINLFHDDMIPAINSANFTLFKRTTISHYFECNEMKLL